LRLSCDEVGSVLLSFRKLLHIASAAEILLAAPAYELQCDQCDQNFANPNTAQRKYRDQVEIGCSPGRHENQTLDVRHEGPDGNQAHQGAEINE